MDKRALVQQLTEKLRDSYEVARRAKEDELRGYSPGEKRMSKLQAERAQLHAAEVSFLETFVPKRLTKGAAINIGAVVEIEDEESGEGRTLFLAPVGAGLELTGPGGDGFLSVITPQSPIGKALLGKRVGDLLELEVKDSTREWVVTYVE